MFSTVFSIISSVVSFSQMVLLEVRHLIQESFLALCNSTSMKVKSTFILLRIFPLYVDPVAIYLLCSLSSDEFVPFTKGFVVKKCLMRKRNPTTKVENIKNQSEISSHSKAVSEAEHI